MIRSQHVQYAEARVQFLSSFKKNNRLKTNQLKYRVAVSQIKLGEGYKQTKGLVGNIFLSIIAYSLFIKSHQKNNQCADTSVEEGWHWSLKVLAKQSRLYKGVESRVLSQM